MTATPVFEGPSNATIGAPAPRAVTAADDPALSDWGRGYRGRSVTALMDAARAKMSRLVRLELGWDGHRGRPTEPLAVMVLNGIFDALLFDDAATPQIAPLPDGGIQVEWLVARDRLTVDVDADGEVFVLATYFDGGEAVEGDFPYWAPDFTLLGQARAFLEKISHEIEGTARLVR